MVTRIGLKSAKPARTYFREWRESKNWTQQELADRLETTAATVSRVEKGERDWGKGYLEAFAFVVGCEPADPITRPPGQVSADELLRNVSPELRNQAIRVVQTLVMTGTDGPRFYPIDTESFDGPEAQPPAKAGQAKEGRHKQ